MCFKFDANDHYTESNFNLLSTESMFEYSSVQLNSFFLHTTFDIIIYNIL